MTRVPPEEQLLAVAERAARAAGTELMRRFGREPTGVRTKSTPTDPVSAADLAAEQAIRDVLAAERPGDLVLGEEGGEAQVGGEAHVGGEAPVGDPGSAALRWVVDPLDGTVNFLYGIPQFAVSVACEDGSGTLAGVVLDPVRAECFAATRNGAPLLNGQPLRVERDAPLSQTLVATGFAYEPDVRAAQAQVITRLVPRVRDIRRNGAAALDLCWCACGRVDAYFERGLRLWDFAAGALLCTRAGLIVRPLPAIEAAGSDVRLPDGLVVAAPPVIDELEDLVS
jgi:myo-inositol-1(or 4)-monophosphatase